jgi:hypothetical protein
MKKIYKIHKDICKKQESLPPIPYEVWTCFWDSPPHLSIYGELGVGFEGDCKSIEEMQTALSWLVDQFGGEVKWK